jgi:hypothetical protein
MTSAGPMARRGIGSSFWGRFPEGEAPDRRAARAERPRWASAAGPKKKDRRLFAWQTWGERKKERLYLRSADFSPRPG